MRPKFKYVQIFPVKKQCSTEYSVSPFSKKKQTLITAILKMKPSKIN